MLRFAVGLTLVTICYTLKLNYQKSFVNSCNTENGVRSYSTKLYTSKQKGFDPFSWLSNFFGGQPQPEKLTEVTLKAMTTVTPEKKPKSAVLVFGGTGKAGKEIVKQLHLQRKDVVIASRSSDESGKNKVLNTIFESDRDVDGIFVKTNVDVTNPESLTASLFDGVETVISCIGPTREENMNAENIDYKGNLALIDATQKYLKYNRSPTLNNIYNFDKNTRNLNHWTNLDDVIMGGKSSSRWDSVDWKGEGSSFARWSGTVITEGGGFASTVCKENNFKINPFIYDGIQIRVRGDGNRYKLRIRTTSLNGGNIIFAAPFDTIKGQWIDIKIPFEHFYNNKQTIINYSSTAPTIQSLQTQEYDIGFIYSKFDFNEQLNSKFFTTNFQLDVESIQLYRDVRPQFVLVSSAGSERINRLTLEERAKDIPIVQLNPLGILNWKYKAETVLRNSGIPYSIIRASGIVPYTAVNNTRQVEFQQTDIFSGRVTREELGALVSNIVGNSYAVDKTFEVRRDESDSGLLDGLNNRPKVQNNYNTLFKKLVLDSDRTIYGMLPFPIAQDPASPLTEEQTKAILADPRVVQVAEREKKEKEAKEAAEASAASST